MDTSTIPVTPSRFTACLAEQLEPPIFRDVNGQERLYECVGTRFLVRFLNPLDAKFPFVDNVKPFSKFIAIFGLSALTPGYGPLTATVMVWAMLKFLECRRCGGRAI